MSVLGPGLIFSRPAAAAAAPGIDPSRYGLTDEPHLLLPDSATPSLVACDAAADTYGAWVQLTAGLGDKTWLLAVLLHRQGGAGSFQVEIGTGAAGSETERWSGAIHLGHGFGQNMVFYPIWLAVEVEANTRMAVRARSAGGGALVQLWVQYKVD